MNILVCVKQVPDTDKIRIDEKTNTLIREDTEGIVNPFDMYALEAAARIKDTHADTKIIVLSMGIIKAQNALRECMAIAADKAYLVSDSCFGGADTFATSYTLSKAIEKIEETEGKIDAVFCGRQAIDGDTAQVGPELSEHLGYPQLTNALEAEAVFDGEGIKLTAVQEREDGKFKVRIGCPCVITFTKSNESVRSASLKRRMAARKKEIVVISGKDMEDIDASCIGLKGSPTRVRRTFVRSGKKKCIKIDCEKPEAAAKSLRSIIRNIQDN